MTIEVKNDVTEDDVKSFEEADEAGEIKTGERELDSEETEETETQEEEESEEEVESDDEVNSSKPEIKEVPGETPKETALRLEVTRLRRKNREREQEELLRNEKQADASGYEDELKELGYDDDQIKTLDKAFDIIGKEKGFVRKDQSYHAMANDTLAEFIEEHPEYKPENDTDDIYWGRFNSILKSDYNLKNKTNKELKSIFNRVHRDLKDELGEDDSDKKVTAQKQKVRSVSTGISASTKTTETKSKVASVGNKTFISSGHPGLNFKGFEEDEVDEFTK